MIVWNNKEYRNLQQQVEKNMKDILFILQEEGVLNEFGIKVVGQEESVIDMPTVADYKEDNPDWSYGDAYAIGTEEPYELYILTRANGTHPNDYWFNIGEFPAPGPEGPEGPEGPQGPQGETGNPGADGLDAGFGTISATATTLDAGEDATVSITTSGPNTAMNMAFSFGIPKGQDGDIGTVEWGEIGGDLSDQTDLVNALQGKQNASNAVTTDTAQTISGNKTLTGTTSFGGSGAISISNTGINVYSPAAIRTYGADVNLSGSLVLGSSNIKTNGSDTYGLVIPTTTSYTANKTIATTDQIPSVNYPVTDVEVNGTSVLSGTVAEIDLSGYVESSDLATVATTGDYDDLLNKPSIPTNYVTTDTDQTISGVKTFSSDVQVGTITGISAGDGVEIEADELTFEATTHGINFINDNATITMPFTSGTVALTSDIPSLSGYATLAGGAQMSPQVFTGWDEFSNPIVIGDVSGNFTAYEDGDIVQYTNGGGTSYTFTLPSASGTLALTSDIPSLSGYATETWVTNQGYLTSVSWSDVSSKPTFATVATSGSYADLSNKPTIPSVSGTNDGTNWTTITINSDTYNIPSGGGSGTVTDVTVNGTSVVTSGVAAVSVPTSASTTVSASSESFTFTYADGTTTTKTFLTAITSATTTLS